MSIGRWMDKEVWYIYTMEYYSAIKKECIWVTSSEVDEPRAYYTSEVSQKVKDKYYMLTHLYGI